MFTAQSIVYMIQNLINTCKMGSQSAKDKSFLTFTNEKNEEVVLSIQYSSNSVSVSHNDKVIKTFTVEAQKDKNDAFRSVRETVLNIKALAV